MQWVHPHAPHVKSWNVEQRAWETSSSLVTQKLPVRDKCVPKVGAPRKSSEKTSVDSFMSPAQMAACIRAVVIWNP